MNKTYVLFDLDGTLTDPMIGITKSVQYALHAYGIEVEDLRELCPFIGPPLKDSFIEFYQFSETQASEAIQKYREYFAVTGLYENLEYPGIKE
ncbi:MAG: HAD hydrolase-like protein, partial [Hungatella sp.]